VEGGRGGQHAPSGGLGDGIFGARVEDARDGGDGHPGVLGDLGDTCHENAEKVFTPGWRMSNHSRGENVCSVKAKRAFLRRP
jgi:hypothetical protein